MRNEIRERIEAVRRGEVPDGYTKTEIGILPEEWAVHPLSEISTVIADQAGEAEFETMSISAGIGFVNQAQKFGKELSGKQYSKYTVLRRGDFAYNKGNSKRYPQGCTYMLREREIAAVPNVFECFRITKGVPEYYEQLFIHGFMNKQLAEKINHGVRDDGLLNLTDEDFYSTRLPFPAAQEQQRIAEILDACDYAIRLKQDLIKEKRNVKRSLMNGLLSTAEMRLPGFKTDEIKDAKLASLVDKIDAGTSVNSIEAETVQYSSDRPFVLKTSCISNGAFILSEIKEVAEQDYGRVSCPIKAETLIVSRMNTPSLVGACAYCGNTKDNVFLPDRLWRVTLKDTVDGHWLNYLLNTSAYQDKLHLLASGTSNSMKNILKEDFLGLQIEVPSLEEQKAIAKVLMCLDQSIEALERELEQWQMKKKALMQLLLTGLVRVNA